MSGVMRVRKSYTKPPIENIIIRNKQWFGNGKCRINNCIIYVQGKCRIMLNRGDKTCMKGGMLRYCIV